MFNRVEADIRYVIFIGVFAMDGLQYVLQILRKDRILRSNKACSVKATDTLEYRGFTTFEYFQRPPDKRASVIDDTFLTKLPRRTNISRDAPKRNYFKGFVFLDKSVWERSIYEMKIFKKKRRLKFVRYFVN